MIEPAKRPLQAPSTARRLRRYLWIAAGAWTVLSLTSLAVNHFNERRWLQDTALIQANIALDRDLLYRQWNAGHGGVYVPVSEQTPPNPYLSHLPTRDVTTNAGQRLTLVNPAYMTRQVHTLEKARRKIQGHLTSLRAINPGNAPDDWERKALGRFEHGLREESGYADLHGKPYFRLMRAFMVEKTCLRCHAAHGFREGEVRGGLSVSVPMEPLAALSRKRIFMTFAGHLLALCIGLLGIALAGRNLLGAERSRSAAQKERARAVEIDLSIARLASALQADLTPDAITDLVRRTAMTITQSPIGFVGQIDPTTRLFFPRVRSAESEAASAAPDQELALGELGRRCGESLERPEGLLVNEVPTDPQATGASEGQGAIQRFLAIPVIKAGEPTLIVALANAPGEYTERDRAAVARIARLYALAIHRQRARDALAAEHTNLRAIFDSSPLAIVELDLGKRVHIWNPAAERLFGWRAAEVLGKVVPIVPEDRTEELAGIVKQAVSEGGAVMGFETVRQHKEGHLINVSLSIAIMKDPGGHIDGVLGLIEEITDRKRLEIEREHLIVELREAIGRVKTLSGIIPICMHCKKIRDDTGYWNQLESFIHEHTQTEGFSHGICPDCLAKLYPEET